MISVLYVDDEPDLLDIARIFLERTGKYTIDTCTSVPDAKRMLASTPYDAIVSDYQMPGEDGIDFLKFVRGHVGPTPFILFTGRGREEVVIQALENGADFYIQKGGDPRAQFAELRNKIEKAVNERRAVLAQKETEQRLTDIINFLPDATLAIDADGTVIAWNDAMVRMTGVPAAEMLGRGNHEYALPFYHERRPILLDLILNYDDHTAQGYDRIWHDGRALISEKFIPHLNGGNGAYLWFIASPLYNRERETVGAIESIRDITGQKKLEWSLRESERRYHNVFDSAAEAMIVIDSASGKILDANAAATYLYGYTLGEFQALCCADLTADGGRMIIPGQMGMLHIPECLHRRKNGEVFPAEISGNIYPQKTRPIAIINLRDITVRKRQEEAEAKRQDELNTAYSQLAVREEELRHQLTLVTDAERALAANKERLDLILMAVNEGIWDWDVPAGTTYFSPTYYTLLGYVLNGIPATYESWREQVHPDDLAQVEPAIQSHIQQRDDKYAFEMRMRTRDGQWKWIMSRGCVVERSEDGAPLRVVGTHTDITEQKAAEDARKESDIRYRSLFENMQEGFAYCRILYDPDGTPSDWVYLDVNRSFERITGLVNITGKRVTETVPGIHAITPELFEYYSTVVQTGIPRTFEIDFKPLGLWLRISVFSPAPGYFISLFDDITARKEMERELRASEQQFRLLVENAPDAIFIQADQRFMYLNPAAIRLFGASSPDDLIGKPIMDRFHPDFHAIVTDRIRLLNEEKKGVPPLAEVYLRMDGTPFDVVVSAFPFVHEEKNGALVFFREITTEKAFEVSLHEGEALFRTLLDTILNPVFIVSPGGRVLFMNKATYQFFETREDVSAGEISIAPYVHPGSLPLLLDNLKTVLAGDGPVTAEYCVVTATGEVRWVEASGVRTEYQGGAADLVTMRDMTGRRQMEQRLKDVNRKMNLLSQITRHDVVNKLTALQGYVELSRGCSANDAFQGLVQKEMDNINQIRRIVAFSREYEEIGVLAPAWQDLDTTVRAAVSGLDLTSIPVTVSGPAVKIYADPLLQKVFYNLFDNALRYGGDQLTRISVSSEISGRDLWVIVEDDGWGIDPAMRPYIFERGYGRNTGFGLCLSKEILGITGISIVEDGAPGGGARFVLTVPGDAWKAKDS